MVLVLKQTATTELEQVPCNITSLLLAGVTSPGILQTGSRICSSPQAPCITKYSAAFPVAYRPFGCRSLFSLRPQALGYSLPRLWCRTGPGARSRRPLPKRDQCQPRPQRLGAVCKPGPHSSLSRPAGGDSGSISRALPTCSRGGPISTVVGTRVSCTRAVRAEAPDSHLWTQLCAAQGPGAVPRSCAHPLASRAHGPFSRHRTGLSAAAPWDQRARCNCCAHHPAGRCAASAGSSGAGAWSGARTHMEAAGPCEGAGGSGGAAEGRRLPGGGGIQLHPGAQGGIASKGEEAADEVTGVASGPEVVVDAVGVAAAVGAAGGAPGSTAPALAPAPAPAEGSLPAERLTVAAAAAVPAERAEGAAEGAAEEAEALTLDLPMTGNLEGVEVLPTAEELQALLLRAVDVAATLAARRPHVTNLDKLTRRIRSDLEFLRRCCLPAAGTAPEAAAVVAGAGAGAATTATTTATVTALTPASTPQPAAGAAPGVTAAAAAAPGPQPAEAVQSSGTADPGGGDGGAAGAGEDGPVDPSGAVVKERGSGAEAPRGGSRGGGCGSGSRVPPPLLLTPVRVQGIINNLRGFQGELLAAQLAPGVVGVLRRFQARVVLPPEEGQRPRKEEGQRPRKPGQERHSAKGQVARRGATTGCGHDPRPPASASATVAAAAPAAAAEGLVGRKRPASTDPVVVAAAAVEAAEAVAYEAEAVGRAGGEETPVATPGGAVEASGVPQTAPATIPPEAQGQAQVPVPGQAGRGSKGGSGGSGGGGGVGPRGAAAGAATGAAAVSVTVEVDVVAQGGHCWIEVKNQEVFGLESVHWTGSSRQAKGLRRQVQELLAVAADPQHHRRWRPPALVLFFPSGVHPDVGRELVAMGAHVAVGPDSLRHLPAPPPAPAATNLDVTTMCGLVSEVSHGGVHDPAVQQWAQRTVHWVECLAAERAQPLLEELAPWLAPGRPLLAAELACRQFQVLLDMFGGPRERDRWAALRGRLTVVDTERQPSELSPRCRQLLAGTLGGDQVAVFGLGDGRRATTLSANGNAVRSAERRGVALEVVLHRPVWLTGR